MYLEQLERRDHVEEKLLPTKPKQKPAPARARTPKPEPKRIDANVNRSRAAVVPRSNRAVRNHRAASEITVEATAYTATCEGCIGITKTGVDVRDTITHDGRRVVAVDPAVIPLGSDVTLTFEDGSTMKATAQDVGGAINGREIDILVGSVDEALRFGRQKVEVSVR